MKPCSGKIAFHTFEEAERARKRLGEVGKCLQSFFCPQCKRFHQGNRKPKEYKLNRKKERIRELAEAERYVDP